MRSFPVDVITGTDDTYKKKLEHFKLSDIYTPEVLFSTLQHLWWKIEEQNKTKQKTNIWRITDDKSFQKISSNMPCHQAITNNQYVEYTLKRLWNIPRAKHLNWRINSIKVCILLFIH